MASGKWLDSVTPKRGWTCLGVDDLKEPSHTCEMCEVQSVRYVHTMAHDDYSDKLRVGRECAGYMEGDLAAPRLREREAKRRANWRNRKWRENRNGNLVVNVNGFRIVVTEKYGWYEVLIKDRRDTNFTKWGKRYRTEWDATQGAFDALIQAEAKRLNYED